MNAPDETGTPASDTNGQVNSAFALPPVNEDGTKVKFDDIPKSKGMPIYPL